MDWKYKIIDLAKKDLGLVEIAQNINSEYELGIDEDSVRYYLTKDKPRKSLKYPADTDKILVLSDIHAPFHREDKIIEIVTQHRDGLSAIIFGGDTIDCKAVSNFPKECRRPLIQEIAITYKLLKRIDRLTPGVKKILIWGN